MNEKNIYRIVIYATESFVLNSYVHCKQIFANFTKNMSHSRILI